MFQLPLLGDNLVLDFLQPVFNVDDDDVTVDVCMTLDGLPMGGLECDLVVPLNLVDGKAGEINVCIYVYTHVCWIYF